MLLIKDSSAWTLKSIGMELSVIVTLTHTYSSRYSTLLVIFSNMIFSFVTPGENCFQLRSFSRSWHTVKNVTTCFVRYHQSCHTVTVEIDVKFDDTDCTSLTLAILCGVIPRILQILESLSNS